MSRTPVEPKKLLRDVPPPWMHALRNPPWWQPVRTSPGLRGAQDCCTAPKYARDGSLFNEMERRRSRACSETVPLMGLTFERCH